MKYPTDEGATTGPAGDLCELRVLHDLPFFPLSAKALFGHCTSRERDLRQKYNFSDIDSVATSALIGNME